MKRTQTAMEQSRPYANKMRAVIGHVAMISSEYHHLICRVTRMQVP